MASELAMVVDEIRLCTVTIALAKLIIGLGTVVPMLSSGRHVVDAKKRNVSVFVVVVLSPPKPRRALARHDPCLFFVPVRQGYLDLT